MRKPADKRIRTVEWVLYNEQVLRVAVEEERERETVDTGKDPTARTAVRHATPIKSLMVEGKEILKPEKWLHMLELVHEHIPKGDMKNVLQARYKRREHYRVTCRKLCMSQSKYQNTIRRIREYAQMVAIQEGLIKIVE